MTVTPPSPEIIYIYAGPGASLVAMKHTAYTLKKLIAPHHRIQTIAPDEVIQGAWAKNAALFVMPGGADIPYGQSLNGRGNQNIQTFVQEGGAYLGLCAGAYYGSKQVVFAFGTPLEVTGNRELSFFPGIAEGPTLAPWDEASNSGAEAALLQWKGQHSPFSKNQLLTCYYNGGGHFVNASSHRYVTILANYETPSPKAAIVEIAAAKGRAILSGVHVEYAPEILDSLDPYLRPIKNELTAKNQDRLALMAHLLERLNIDTISL